MNKPLGFQITSLVPSLIEALLHRVQNTSKYKSTVDSPVNPISKVSMTLKTKADQPESDLLGLFKYTIQSIEDYFRGLQIVLLE